MSLEEPHLIRWLILAPILLFGLMFPVLAKEAEPDLISHYYKWDYGAIVMPVIIETVKTVQEPIEAPPSVKPVNHYGNGTCVPYARLRSGIKMFGWAGSFLDRAIGDGFTVTEVPQIGCIMVTKEGGGHVAVVEDIGEKGILISEQNYKGLYVVSERWVGADDELILGYIY